MKKFLISLVVGAFLFGPLTTHAQAAAETVYDALPSVSPDTNYPSQPFQAQQTYEFGDYIHLGGTARVLNTVTVTMSDWAKYSDYTGDSRYNENSSTWTHPITLNVYTNHLNADGAPDQKIATVTQNITIPWRPESDPSCGDTSNGKGWKENDVCFNYSGIAFNATFDLSSLKVNLPNDIIVSVAYNTQTWGDNPIGLNGPYNSLNVAVPENQSSSVGSDNDIDSTFWNTHTCTWYSSTSAISNCTSGNFGLYEDNNWTPYGTVALKVTANLLSPTNKDQCKNNGWKNLVDLNGNSFKNQGGCVSFVATHYKTFSASDSQYYNCPTVCGDLYANGPITFNWDKATGNVTDGFWDEIHPASTGTHYYSPIVGGTVDGNNVTLHFHRTSGYSFDFNGTLIDGVLSGQAAGPYYFTATGN